VCTIKFVKLSRKVVREAAKLALFENVELELRSDTYIGSLKESKKFKQRREPGKLNVQKIFNSLAVQKINGRSAAARPYMLTLRTWGRNEVRIELRRVR
jgi:hypothetical protein